MMSSITKSMVAFTDDDGTVAGIDNFTSIIKEKNIKMSFGVPVVSITNETLPKLLTLQNDLSCEIMAHGLTNDNFKLYTEEQVANDLLESKKQLASKGLFARGMITPNSRYDDIVLKYSKINYEYVCGASDNFTRNDNLNRYNIYRVGLGAYWSTWLNTKINSSYATNTYEFFRDLIDYATVNNIFLVFMVHGSQNTTETWTMIRNLIDYIKSKNLDIVTVGEGYDKIFNEKRFINTNQMFSIVKSLKSSIKNVFAFKDAYGENPVNFNTPISEFKNGITRTVLGGNLTGTNYPEVGEAILITHKIENYNDLVSYQEFIAKNTSSIYVRFWDNQNSIWTSFKKSNTVTNKMDFKTISTTTTTILDLNNMSNQATIKLIGTGFNITDCVNGVNGQELTIISSADGNTITSSSNFYLKGGLTTTFGFNNAITLIKSDNRWIEKCRNF